MISIPEYEFSKDEGEN